jgi:hypothetical protein
MLPSVRQATAVLSVYSRRSALNKKFDLALSLGAVAAGVRNREGKWQQAEIPSAPTAKEPIAGDDPRPN